MALNFTRTCAANELRRNSKLRQTKCSPNVLPFVGKHNAFMMGPKSRFDKTTKKKTFGHAFRCLDFHDF